MSDQQQNPPAIFTVRSNLCGVGVVQLGDGRKAPLIQLGVPGLIDVHHVLDDPAQIDQIIDELRRARDAMPARLLVAGQMPPGRP